MQQFILSKDINNSVSYGLVFPDPDVNDSSYSATIAASTEKTVTIPSNADTVIVSVSTGGNVLVGLGSVGLTAPGANFALNIGEVNPVKRAVTAGDTLRVLNLSSTDAAIVTLRFFKEKAD